MTTLLKRKCESSNSWIKSKRSMSESAALDGILVIDKPAGITSHDVVQRVRKLLKTSRVGHLGTLDPMATGVLLLCVGRATRIGRFLTTSPKEYVGEIRFGFATTTYDREGEPLGPEQPVKHTQEEVAKAMNALTGAFEQKPPLVSAKKLGGVPSYKLARRGVLVEPVAVPVEVFAFELVGFSPARVEFRVECSTGTYVRSLAQDLGQQLGCGAHLGSLRRVRSGDFGIDRAVPLSDATASDLIPLEGLLTSLQRLEVAGDLLEERVRHGNPVQSELAPGLACIFNKKGEFLAIASVENGWAHPRVVLTSRPSAEPRKPH
jgi:tRNA pseudouridine55 synthase